MVAADVSLAGTLLRIPSLSPATKNGWDPINFMVFIGLIACDVKIEVCLFFKSAAMLLSGCRMPDCLGHLWKDNWDQSKILSPEDLVNFGCKFYSYPKYLKDPNCKSLRMKIYKIRTDFDQYQVLQIDSVEVVEQLDKEDILMDIVNMSASADSFADVWETVESKFAPVPDIPSAVKIPDISIWKGAELVFSGRAHAYFRLMLEPFGEFLPVKVEGYDFYIFHIMEEGRVDFDNSSRENDPFGEPMTVTALQFENEDVENKLIFKSGYDFYLSVFCNQNFKDLYEEYDLEGLMFEEDLAGKGWR